MFLALHMCIYVHVINCCCQTKVTPASAFLEVRKQICWPLCIFELIQWGLKRFYELKWLWIFDQLVDDQVIPAENIKSTPLMSFNLNVKDLLAKNGWEIYTFRQRKDNKARVTFFELNASLAGYAISCTCRCTLCILQHFYPVILICPQRESFNL